jgi:hypothetical protein
MKITLELSAEQLAQLLAIPAFSQIIESTGMQVDSGAGTLPKSEYMAPTSSTRDRGVSEFVREAENRGYSVRRTPEGEADLILEARGQSWPVVVASSQSPRISIRREWDHTSRLVIALVWTPSETAGSRMFLLRFADLATILAKAMKTESYLKLGFYTTICTPAGAEKLRPFENRWSAFEG